MRGCSFLPRVEGYIKNQILSIWKLFDIRYNMVEITFSKKVKYIIRFNICFFKVFCIYLFIFSFSFLLLTNKKPPKSTLQILVLITFAFVSSNATLNIFWLFLSKYILNCGPHNTRELVFTFYFVQIKFSVMPTVLQTLWSSLGLHKIMFSKVAASYISPV